MMQKEFDICRQTQTKIGRAMGSRDSELRRKQKLGEFELVSFSKENARDASAQVTKDVEILTSVLRFS